MVTELPARSAQCWPPRRSDGEVGCLTSICDTDQGKALTSKPLPNALRDVPIEYNMKGSAGVGRPIHPINCFIQHLFSFKGLEERLGNSSGTVLFFVIIGDWRNFNFLLLALHVLSEALSGVNEPGSRLRYHFVSPSPRLQLVVKRVSSAAMKVAGGCWPA